MRIIAYLLWLVVCFGIGSGIRVVFNYFDASLLTVCVVGIPICVVVGVFTSSYAHNLIWGEIK